MQSIRVQENNKVQSVIFFYCYFCVFLEEHGFYLGNNVLLKINTGIQTPAKFIQIDDCVMHS